MNKIIHDIEHYTLKDYQKITNDFINYFSKEYPKSISLYQFGNTSHPSVSDLDLAIVIDEDTFPKEKIQTLIDDAKQFVLENATRRYIFTHGILIYTKITFQGHAYIHFTPNLQLLFGNEIKQENIHNLSELWDLRFVSYASNTLKNFERINKKEQIGLRDILKIFQNVYHQFSILEIKGHSPKNECLSEKIKQKRWEALQDWSEKKEKEVLHFYYEIYEELKKYYFQYMDTLSIKMFSTQMTNKIFVLENKHFEKRHALFIELAAVYGKIFQEEANCYAKVHQTMFPLRKKNHHLHESYEILIRKQAQVLLPACQLYKKYSATQVLGPMMCYHCSPILSKKQQIIAIAQKLLFRIQGI